MTQTIYIPRSIKDGEMPEKDGEYITFIWRGDKPMYVEKFQYEKDKNVFHVPIIFEQPTHWLEPKSNMVVMTVEEFKANNLLHYGTGQSETREGMVDEMIDFAKWFKAKAGITITGAVIINEMPLRYDEVYEEYLNEKAK